MNQTELEKCKNDPVYFAEKYLGAELKQWQKIYLKIIHKHSGLYFSSRQYGRLMLYDLRKKYHEIFK